MQNKTLKYIIKAVAAFFVTLAVLFVLLLAACALPGQGVRAHVYASIETLRQEGLYPEYFGFKLFQMDNYTDTIMLFEAAAADETDPLTAMMVNTTYNVDNFETMHEDLAWYLERDLATGAQRTDAPTLTAFSYSRYWHGYLIWLRPLLLLFTYPQIRVIQYIALFALLGFILYRLYRACGRRVAAWFAASQLLVAVFFVPRQVQFFTCFFIAYIGCAWVLGAKRPQKDARAFTLGLLVLGVCTSFCDLLVTPIITLALPMAVWLTLVPQRLRSGVAQCGAVVSGSLCWGVGYGGAWAAKWVMASLITGQDVIGDAIHQAGVRTSADVWHGIELTWGNILSYIADTLSAHGLLWPLAILAVLAVAAFFICLRSRQALARALPLGLTALMAPAWLALLRTHSIQHGWFTWRALAPTIFAGMAFVYYSCGIRAGLRRIGRKRVD